MDTNANDHQILQKRSRAVANEHLDGIDLGVESLAPPKLFADSTPVVPTSQLKEEGEGPIEENKEPIHASPEPTVTEAATVDLAPVVPVVKPLQRKEEGQEEAEVQEVQLKSFADAPSELPNDDESGSSGGDPPSDLSNNPESKSSPLSRTAQKKEGDSPTSSGTSNSGISNDVMGKMETTIGHDFSNVNIHTDSSKASEVGALAYTQGTDIHFAPGQFSPSSSSGQELLGHELTHVKQQAQGRVQPTTQASNGMAVNDDKGLEAEADAFGAKAASSTAPVQKKEDKNSTLPNTNGPIQKKEDVSQLDEDEAPAEVPNDAIFRRGSTTIIYEDDNYNISGKYRDIVRQLAADGEDGSISTSFDDIVTSSSGGSNARVDLTVKIVKRMPVWTDLPQVQALANDEDEPQRAYYQNIVNAWNEFYAALDAHEEGHKAIDVAHFTNCHRSLIGKKMGELDNQLTAIEDAATALHTTFHEEHGAQETIRDVQRPYEVTADESDDDEDSVQYKVDPNISKSNDLDVPSQVAPMQRKENRDDGVENSTSNQEFFPLKINQSPSSSNDGVAQGFFPLIALGAAAFGVGFGVGYTAGTAASSRHTDRNQNNQLPTGILRKQSDGSSGSYIYDQGGDNNYVDATERVWVLMSEGESVYHQPKEIVDGAIDHQWQRLQAWWNNQDMASLPNKKFISRDDQGGSFEAVLQPNEDGSYTTNWLNSGTQQGTYNYSSPESLGGKIGHFVDDVLPHYLNEDYSATPTQQKSDRTIQRKVEAESPLVLETIRSNETAQLDAGDGDTTTSLALSFPFDIAAARTNARAAWSFLQLQGLFDSLKREIDGSEHYSGDTSDLADASSQMTGTIRTFASREQDGILQNGEIFLLQPFINGFEDTYNTSFRGFRSSVISNINSSRNSREFEPMTAEMAEAKRQAFENGDDDQLERIQSLTDSIKDYNEKVSNYIGYASRVSSRVRSSATLQAISSATGNIAEYAGKAGQIVTAMHIVADFATDSSNSELHTSINRVQRGLDGINLGMSFVTAVPVLGFLWEHYYYPAATFCLTKIGEIASRRNRDRRLLTWIGNNWRSSRPPAIDATMEVAFPGGQPVFSFLWHLFFGNYHYNSTAEEYFMDHETDINAGVPNNMRVTGKWNPFVDNHISGFQYWADGNKMDLWLMFYGADLPFPGTGSVEQSLGDYNDDVAQRATSPVSNDHSPVDGSGIIQKMEASFGTSFSDVKIHENSSKPSDLGALAYAQGTDIHFAPGQFKPDTRAGQELIGHELAHVQQQKEGRVQPTSKANNGTPVNDDRTLEKEADDFGSVYAQSIQTKSDTVSGSKVENPFVLGSSSSLGKESKEEAVQKKAIGQFSAGDVFSSSNQSRNDTGKAFQLKSEQISTNGISALVNSHDSAINHGPKQFKTETTSSRKVSHDFQKSQDRLNSPTQMGHASVNAVEGFESQVNEMGSKVAQGKFDEPFQLVSKPKSVGVVQRFEMPQWMQDSSDWVGDRADEVGDAVSDVGDMALEAILEGIDTLEDLLGYLATVSVSMARRVLEAIYRNKRALLIDFITFNPTHGLITIVLDIVSTEDIVKALQAMGSATLAGLVTYLQSIEELGRISAALVQLSAETLMNMIKNLSDELVEAVVFANDVLLEVLKTVVDEVWPVGVGLDFQAGIGATFGYPIYIGGEGECYVQHHNRNGFKLYKRGKLRVGADTGVGAGVFFGSGRHRGGNDAQSGMEWGIGATAGAQAEAGLQIEAIQEFEFPIYEDFAFLSFVLASSNSDPHSMLMTLASLGRVNLNPMQYNTRSQLSGGLYGGASAEAFAGVSLGGDNTQRGAGNASSWRNTDEERPNYGSAENAPWYSWRSLVRKLSASANGQLRLEGNVGVEMKNEDFSVNEQTNQREPGTVKLSLFAEGSGAINLNAAFTFINIPLLNQDHTLGVKINFEFTRGGTATNGEEEPNMSYKGYNIFHQSGDTESLAGSSSETSIESIGDIGAIVNFDQYIGNLNSVERSGTMALGTPFGYAYLRNMRRQQGVRSLLGNNYGTSANNSQGSRSGQTQMDWGGNIEGQLIYKFKIKREGLFAIFTKAYELFQQNFTNTDAWERLVADVQGIFSNGTVPSYLTELIDFAIPHIEMKELKLRTLVSAGLAGGAHAAEGAKVRLHGNISGTYFRDYNILSQLGADGGFTSDELRELLVGQAARLAGQGGE